MRVKQRSLHKECAVVLRYYEILPAIIKEMYSIQCGGLIICQFDFAVFWLVLHVATENGFRFRLAAPLTDEQKFELEVERKLLAEWPKEQRKTYRANQELVSMKL